MKIASTRYVYEPVVIRWRQRVVLYFKTLGLAFIQRPPKSYLRLTEVGPCDPRYGMGFEMVRHGIEYPKIKLPHE